MCTAADMCAHTTKKKTKREAIGSSLNQQDAGRFAPPVRGYRLMLFPHGGEVWSSSQNAIFFSPAEEQTVFQDFNNSAALRRFLTQILTIQRLSIVHIVKKDVEEKSKLILHVNVRQTLWKNIEAFLSFF